MTESFLHYIWKYKLFDAAFLQTKTGEKVEILHTGLHNTDSGPDFFNARIKIGDTTWAGNVEIHLNSSDWFHHNHHKDTAYDSVIAHVVYQDDAEISRKNGSIIPTIKLNFNKDIFSKYESLLQNEQWIHCTNEIIHVDKTAKELWIASLAVERIYHKSETIKQRLEINQNNWEETLYHFLARGFGFNVNADPFELLAKSIPLKCFSKIKDQKNAIETLLMGQAGFLKEEISDDEYYKVLKKEYTFLQKKFNIQPLDHHLWKFLRIRPSNFPTIRISQFANFIYKLNGAFSTIIETKSINELKRLFDINASDYWDDHYQFGKISAYKKKNFGEEAFQLVMINTIVPFLFIYGKIKAIDRYSDLAINYLEQLKPEINSVITNWKKLDFKIPDAFHSQALIELKKEYCQKDRCLDCSFGNKIITNQIIKANK
jgi:hypothetical protein